MAQYPFASTASWKQREKITQFRPDASSFGTDEGRVLARAVAVTVDIVDNGRGHRWGSSQRKQGPNNL